MGTKLRIGADRPSVQTSWPRSQDPVRVGLIENHRLLRERLTDLLKRQPGLYVTASAEATPVGLERLRMARPQVVVIGSAVDGTVCRECLRGVREGLPDARVVVMNVSVTREDVIELIEQGASGLLLPEATLNDFLRAIQLVAGGTNVVPDPLVPLLFAHLAHPETRRPAAAGGDPNAPLTHREREIGSLISEGRSNQSIAGHLGISLHTVKSHIAKILAKLQFHSRLQIAVHFNRGASSRPSADRLEAVQR